MAIPDSKQQIFQLTESAAVRIKELIAKRDKPAAGIKVGIKPGGCSGLKYQFEYADEIEPNQEVVVDKGVTVVIDPAAILYLIGTTLDFKDEKVSSGFVFQNPNEKASCGCGESFSA